MHKNHQWALENMQCIYSHGPFRLQAQQAFSDQQKFGSEVWDALDSNHEVPNNLQSTAPSAHTVTPLQSGWQQGQMTAFSAWDTEPLQNRHRLTKQNAELLLCAKKGWVVVSTKDMSRAKGVSEESKEIKEDRSSEAFLAIAIDYITHLF